MMPPMSGKQARAAATLEGRPVESLVTFSPRGGGSGGGFGFGGIGSGAGGGDVGSKESAMVTVR